MFLLPVQHDNMTVRRLPWISLGIFAACLVIHVFVAASSGRLERAAERSFTAVVRYYVEHPRVKVAPDTEKLLRLAIGEREMDTLRTVASARVTGDEDAREIEAEQAKWDELAGALRAAMASSPYVRWGLIPASMSLLALVTHMFLHGGWLHLAGNMFFLYLAGPFIEDAWGRVFYASFYLASGFAAALGYATMFPSLATPMVGASGAIAGLMGAFLVRFWSTRIQFAYMMLGFGVRGTFWAPAWLMLPLWLAQQVFFGLLSQAVQENGGSGGVAYWAHVAGFVFGAAVALLVKQARIEERFFAPAIEREITTKVEGNDVIEQAYAARAGGDLDGALRLLHAEWERRPNPHVGIVLWVLALEANRGAEAVPVLTEVVRQELREGQNDLACQHWLELIQQAPDARMDVPALLRLVPLLRAFGTPDDAARALRTAMLSGGTGMPAGVALRIARLANDLDPRLAASAARLALRRPDLSAIEREEADRILAELAAPSVS